MRRTSLIAASALFFAATSASAQAPFGAATKLLPGTRSSVLASIQGNAVSASNGAMNDTVIRLRDARYGRIVDTVISDKQGGFIFRGVDPGNYVVEVMSPSNNAVLASSQMLNVSAGEAVSPARSPSRAAART